MRPIKGDRDAERTVDVNPTVPTTRLPGRPVKHKNASVCLAAAALPVLCLFFLTLKHCISTGSDFINFIPAC